MNVREIVEGYLKSNGYTGLVYDWGECGCTIDDLAPCDGVLSECEPGYKVTCTCEEHADFGWHVQGAKEGSDGTT